ncbi:MAG: hypothetical protein LIO94_13000 [Clostridiales bacterium]|nr:hypothetical protein [Clostridiales bacterium]
MKKHTKLFVLFLLVFCFFIPAKAEASAQIPTSLYKKIKGTWYTQSSSGGCDVKFTRTRIKYYSRTNGKLVFNYKIVKVKKVTKGTYKGCYKIYFKNKYGTLMYFVNVDKKATAFDFYNKTSKGSWEAAMGSSLNKGKWSTS